MFLEQHRGYYNFRLKGFQNDFDSLSISFPPDVNRTQILKEGKAQIIETALIKNNVLVYLPQLGYDDTLRWSNYQELLEEIIRFYSFNLFWSIYDHHYFPNKQKNVIFTVLLVGNRLWEQDKIPYLPVELWLIILNCLSSQVIGHKN